MTELVKIYNTVKIGNEEVNSVNARDLHKALESGKDFSNWIKHRITKLNLTEGIDYVVLKVENVLAQIGEQPIKGVSGGGHNKIDYYVSIDVAKHIAMMEATEKGREVRNYFIECEKQLRQIQPQFKLPQTYKEALIELVNQIEINEQLQIDNQEKQKVIEYQESKIENYDYVEATRRSKQELVSRLNKTVRLLAEQKFNKNYREAYRFVYGEFSKLHCIKEKINLEYLKTNNDYLAECLSIATCELK